NKDDNVHEVPGIDSDTALAFYLAEKHLEPLLPRTTIKRLTPHFKRAEEVLDQADADRGNPAWRNKVRVLHRGPGLKNPAIASDVQSAIYDALLRNRRLDVAYLPRGKDEAKQYELNPLGLVLKDGLFYLVCSMWDYPDIRLLLLHRMKSADVMDIPCIAPEDFDLDGYIESGELDFAVGDAIELKAWISETMAIHLQERPLHSNQLISISDNGRILLNVTVQDTNELRWWLLGFGDQVEILAPEGLRSDFHAIANNMAKAYQRKQEA
ncbi:MAG: helix-turn-helix transcriptional regulator, partial [Mariprofundus sp.]